MITNGKNGSHSRLAVVPRTDLELQRVVASERKLVGAVILCPSLLSKLAGVAVSAFVDALCAEAWGAIRNLEARNEEIGVIAIADELERRDREVGRTDLQHAGRIGELVLPFSHVAEIDPDEVALLGADLMRVQGARADLVDPDVEASAERDREPTFDELLVQARADVQEALGRERLRKEPLFSDDAVDILERKFDAPRWLVTGLLTRGGIGMIGAEPKTAKTWLATEIAVAIATGTRVCGEFSVPRGRVLYFYAEDLAVQVRNRVRALLKGGSRTLERGQLYLEPRGRFLDLLIDEDLAWIVASARRLGTFDLLVLDPLRDVHSGEEDKSDSMRDVMRRLRVLTELLGSVLVTHHTPKATKDTAKRRPGQNLRGSSSIHGSVDSGLYLEEIKSDGTNEFANRVRSQVKGARSAGEFQVDLKLIDDDQGEALQATWKVTGASAVAASKPAITRADEEHEADELVLAFVTSLAKRGELFSRTQLRSHKERPAAVSSKKVVAILDRLITRGRLKFDAGTVIVPGVIVSGQHTLKIEAAGPSSAPVEGANDGAV